MTACWFPKEFHVLAWEYRLLLICFVRSYYHMTSTKLTSLGSEQHSSHHCCITPCDIIPQRINNYFSWHLQEVVSSLLCLLSLCSSGEFSTPASLSSLIWATSAPMMWTSSCKWQKLHSWWRFMLVRTATCQSLMSAIHHHITSDTAW